MRAESDPLVLRGMVAWALPVMRQPEVPLLLPADWTHSSWPAGFAGAPELSSDMQVWAP